MSETETVKPTRTLIPIPVFEKAPAGVAPRFMVVGGALVAQSDEGEFVISLKVPTKVVPLMEDLSPLEQIKVLLQSRGAEEDIERLGELDIIDSREIARKFFQAFGEKEEARLGESFTSSE